MFHYVWITVQYNYLMKSNSTYLQAALCFILTHSSFFHTCARFNLQACILVPWVDCKRRYIYLLSSTLRQSMHMFSCMYIDGHRWVCMHAYCNVILGIHLFFKLNSPFHYGNYKYDFCLSQLQLHQFSMLWNFVFYSTA